MKNLIQTLLDLNISISVEDEQLKVYDASNNLTDSLLNRIRENKPELIKLIRDMDGGYRFKAIEQAQGNNDYALSFNQRRLYFLQQYNPASIAYNMPIVYRVKGALDKQRLQECFQQLINRHEGLRTTFHLINDEPRQQVHEKLVFHISSYDCRDQQPERYISSFIRPFDLGECPLIRVGIVQISNDDCLLIIDIHHIVTDGLSQEILVREFMTLYRKEPLPAISIQYKDFAEWQQRPGERKRSAQHKEYWTNLFSGELPLLNLCTDHNRPVVRSEEGRSYNTVIGTPLSTALRELAKQQQVSLYIVLLAAYKVWLYKLSNQSDIIVGTSIAGRQHVDIENVVGMFVNTLPLRSKLDLTASFSSILQELKNHMLIAQEHQDYPYERLIDELQLERDTSRNPLFDVMFVFQNMDMPEIRIAGLEFQPYTFEKEQVKFDLNLIIEDQDDQLKLFFEYATSLFKADSITCMAGYFINLLQIITTHPDMALGRIEIIGAEEKKQLLYTNNNTEAFYEQNRTIHSLFEEQVLKTPDHVAAIYNNEQVTYAELNRRANQVAYAIINRKTGIGKYIPLVLDRSIEMLAAMIGVLKSGHAYIPIEPDLPAIRIADILNTANAGIIITRRALDGITISEADAFTRLFIDELSTDMGPGVDINPLLTQSAEDDAYIIFTSGSTGKSKGVLVKHQPVVNLIQWVNNTYEVNEQDRLLFTASYSFDLSVYDVFGVLATGGSVQIVANADLRDPRKMLDMIFECGVTFWDSVPAVLQQLVPFMDNRNNNAHPAALRLVFLSGDWIPLTLPPTLKKHFPQVRVIGLGGATEAAIWSNYFEIGGIDAEWKSIPYGVPIQNAKYYVLHDFMNVCPMNVPGNLYIGGECLAEGYINDEALTASKFLSNPFVKNGRMYKTGDLAKWKPAGYIEFLGRKDFQVKIRGFRVELGDIEHNLRQHPAMKEVFVLDKTDSNKQKYICAYFIAEETLNPRELRAFLDARLPAYMIPSFFVQLDKVPLTANGKIDRSQFPDPNMAVTRENTYEAPQTETEKLLQEVWEQVLDYRPIGRADNFFNIGGDSIKSIQISARMADAGYILKVTEIFRYPTIAQLALKIVSAVKSNSVNDAIAGSRFADAIPEELRKKQQYKDVYPLSYMQEALYFNQYLDPHSFNIIQSFHFNEALDWAAFQDSIAQVYARYDILNANIVSSHDKSFLVIPSSWPLPLHYRKLGTGELLGEATEAIKNEITKTPIDLEKDPLIDITVVEGTAPEFEVIVHYHEIILDGWSTHLLFGEILQVYHASRQKKAVTLPVAPPFRIFIQWLYERNINEAATYWQHYLSGYRKKINIQDFSGTAAGTVKNMSFKLDKGVYAALQTYAKKNDCTINTIVQTIWSSLLCKYFGVNDIVFGTGISIRPEAIPQAEFMVGKMFNVIPVRIRYSAEDTFLKVLKDTQMHFVESFSHAWYPLSKIKADGGFDQGLTDHSLVFNNYPRQEGALIAGINRSMLHVFSNDALDINIELVDTVMVIFRYKEAQHRIDKLQKWLRDFEMAFSRILAEDALLFSQLVTTEHKKEQLMKASFNEEL